MARRNKHDMELMNNECRYYLLQTNNNPHKAYDLFIKEHLESQTWLPYYVKGIKDFITVSQELALELNRKEQMNKADKERFESKEIIINYILGLSVEEMKVVYKQYKDIVSQSDKLVIYDVYMLIYSNDLQKKYIDQQTINVFSKIYKDQLLPA